MKMGSTCCHGDEPGISAEIPDIANACTAAGWKVKISKKSSWTFDGYLKFKLSKLKSHVCYI